jgi:hypothetical protein
MPDFSLALRAPSIHDPSAASVTSDFCGAHGRTIPISEIAISCSDGLRSMSTLAQRRTTDCNATISFVALLGDNVATWLAIEIARFGNIIMEP